VGSKSRKIVVKRPARNAARWIRWEKIRAAELSFLTDRQRHAPEYWWDQLCREHISLKEFMLLVRRGEWVQRRDQYWEEVRQDVLRQSKYRAIHDYVTQLQELETVRADVLELISPKIRNGIKTYPVKPGSLEGMIGALCKLDRVASDKRDTVLTMIEPELVQSRDDQGTEFTADQWRSIAAGLLEARVKEQDTRFIESRSHGNQEGSGEEGSGEEEND